MNANFPKVTFRYPIGVPVKVLPLPASLDTTRFIAKHGDPVGKVTAVIAHVSRNGRPSYILRNFPAAYFDENYLAPALDFTPGSWQELQDLLGFDLRIGRKG